MVLPAQAPLALRLGVARSGAYLLFVFLGGSGTFVGPMLGGVLLVLATVWLSEITPAWMLYMGLAFLLMVMHAPGGLVSLLAWPRRLQSRHAALALAWLALLAGSVALVEMLYRLRLDAAGQNAFSMAGLSLDTRHGLPWLLAVLLVAAGGAGLRVLSGGKRGG